MCKRCIGRSTDIYRVVEVVGLVNGQIQAVNTVTAMDARHQIPVCAAHIEQVNIRTVFLCRLIIPCMFPCVRQLAIRDSNMFNYRQDPRTDIELQCDE